jgi:archaemetzincin
VHELIVVPLGDVDRFWLEAAAGCASDIMRMQPLLAPPLPVPQSAHDINRRQYLSTALLESLLPIGRASAARVLGVTEADLFIPILTFLFGQAQLGGRLALVSLARIRPEFYRFPPDQALTHLRLRKEIRHELGHTLGLVHCADTRCAMSLSNSIVQVDAKDDSLCGACLRLAQARLNVLHSGDLA